MHLTTFAAVAALSHCSRAFPVVEEPRGIEPCQQVREHVDAWISENGVVPRNLTRIEQGVRLGSIPPVPIRPSLAYACLKSVPLHKETALGHLDVLRPLMEWQSTIDYLRDPPKGYLSEGVDLVRGLDEIQAKVERGKDYKSEFDFLADLYTLSVRIRDVHYYHRELLMDLFTFKLGVDFISISKDGVSKPDIFLYDDVDHNANGYSPSPVSTIDGVPAEEFLLRASVFDIITHDPDARINRLFPSVTKSSTLSYYKATPFALNLADKTTVKLKNGTRLEFVNTALFRAKFTNISSGSDLFKQYGLGNGTAPLPSMIEPYRWTELNFSSSYEGYPTSFNHTQTVGGFLFNDTKELSDVAVMPVNSFMTVPDIYASDFIYGHDMLVFYETVAGFLREAKQQGKSKLILDLQANGGGTFGALHTLYLSLFPNGHNIFPALYQMRAHPQFEWIGNVTSNASEPTQLPSNLQRNLFVKPGSDGLDSNWTLWESFQEFYGPVKGYKGLGEYTRPSLVRTDVELHYGVYDFKPPFEEPPFGPEDIIILTDGECASACAIFTDALVNVHGVRTVAMGGRALEAPMQAVGQIKAGPMSSLDRILAPGAVELDRSNVPDGLKLPPPTNSTLPLRMNSAELGGWATGVSFNVANVIPWDSPNDGEGALPYQMMYEAANCKLFYTWDMTREIVNVWKTVANVAWNGGKCVKGSTTTKDGSIGGVPKYSSKVEDRYSLGPGPGALKK